MQFVELGDGDKFEHYKGHGKCLSHVAKMHIFNMNNDALNSYISHKHHCWVVLNFPQSFIKSQSFLWLGVLLFELLVRINILWSKKCPINSTTSC